MIVRKLLFPRLYKGLNLQLHYIVLYVMKELKSGDCSILYPLNTGNTIQYSLIFKPATFITVHIVMGKHQDFLEIMKH